MELFDNIRNCNKNASAVKKAKKREKVECGVIAILSGALIGTVVKHCAEKKERDEYKRSNDKRTDKLSKRISDAWDALNGKSKEIIDTTAEEVEEVKDAVKETIKDVKEDFKEVVNDN